VRCPPTIDVARREFTVIQSTELYAANVTDHPNECTRRYILARLNHHVVPLLGRKKISDLRVADVEQFMRDVRTGKTAKNEKGDHPRARVIVRGGAGAATKGVRDLSAVFTFAVRQELLTGNPCAPVKKPADGKRTRYLSLEEIQKLGNALETIEAEGTNPKALAIMRLWVLTGCRRDEIAGLKWSEIDFERACIRLDETKTGRSVRPLASAALALLQAQTRLASCPYVFPSENGKTYYQGTKRLWARVVQRAELPGVTPHTLGHMIGSASVETMAMTAAILGRANHQSTSSFAHMQQDPACRAADGDVGPIATAFELKTRNRRR
jgi:integrase